MHAAYVTSDQSKHSIESYTSQQVYPTIWLYPTKSIGWPQPVITNPVSGPCCKDTCLEFLRLIYLLHREHWLQTLIRLLDRPSWSPTCKHWKTRICISFETLDFASCENKESSKSYKAWYITRYWKIIFYLLQYKYHRLKVMVTTQTATDKTARICARRRVISVEGINNNNNNKLILRR